jgi:hypothetical protein
VEFIYTSVSGTDTSSFVTTPHAAFIFARADFVNVDHLQRRKLVLQSREQIGQNRAEIVVSLLWIHPGNQNDSWAIWGRERLELATCPRLLQ